jgi:hypothetical protein
MRARTLAESCPEVNALEATRSWSRVDEICCFFTVAYRKFLSGKDGTKVLKPIGSASSRLTATLPVRLCFS